MSKKKTMMAIICSGMLLFSGGWYVFSTSKTEAAVAVIDIKNIAEAVKTAINTANILTAEEKQLLIDIINTKKIDVGRLVRYAERQKRQENVILSEHHQYEGALNPHKSVDSFLYNDLGSIEEILSGQVEAGDLVVNYEQAMKASEKANHDAMISAKNITENNKGLMLQTKESLEDAINAEGEMQAQQASVNMSAVQAQALVQQNQLLATMNQQAAIKAQKENIKEAQEKEYARQIGRQVTGDIDTMLAKVKDPWQK